MRAWTLGLSIVFHVCLITGVIVAPLFATGDLPVPAHATEWVRVSAVMPPDPPAAPHQPAPPAPTSIGAPLEPPDIIAPEPPQVPEPRAVDVGIAGPVPSGPGFVAGGSGTVDLLTPPPPPPPPQAPPVHVGGLVRAPQKVRDVAPRYPAIALASRIEGLVILEAVIGENGAVRDVRVLRSHPLLEAAALEAVRQWQFTPTLLNGQPVPVVMTVTVSFSLK